MLDAIEQLTGLTVFPNLSTSTDECIVYSLEQVSDDGVKKTERFTVRIITKDMAYKYSNDRAELSQYF